MRQIKNISKSLVAIIILLMIYSIYTIVKDNDKKVDSLTINLKSLKKKNHIYHIEELKYKQQLEKNKLKNLSYKITTDEIKMFFNNYGAVKQLNNINGVKAKILRIKKHKHYMNSFIITIKIKTILKHFILKDLNKPLLYILNKYGLVIKNKPLNKNESLIDLIYVYQPRKEITNGKK